MGTLHASPIQLNKSTRQTDKLKPAECSSSHDQGGEDRQEDFIVVKCQKQLTSQAECRWTVFKMLSTAAEPLWGMARWSLLNAHFKSDWLLSSRLWEEGTLLKTTCSSVFVLNRRRDCSVLARWLNVVFFNPSLFCGGKSAGAERRVDGVQIEV